jgi:hypothetical protein
MQNYAFQPMTDATHGLLPPLVLTVATAGTAVTGNLPPANSGAQAIPQQLYIFNETTSVAQVNIGTAAQIAAYPASPTIGIDIPAGGFKVITIDPEATTASAVAGAAGTGVIKIYRGEGT